MTYLSSRVIRVPVTMTPATETEHKMPEVGEFTPWGNAQTVTHIAEGVVHVETMGHGGFYVTPALRDRVPEAWRRIRHGLNSAPDSQWFEEDCDWALVVMAIPELFTAGVQARAREVFNFFHKPKVGSVD